MARAEPALKRMLAGLYKLHSKSKLWQDKLSRKCGAVSLTVHKLP
jgi:hypothetical protein